ncbi:MAG: CRTAC1 family protein, partial [bacterium]|nr:CRTAC1 family protein [bacterium]
QGRTQVRTIGSQPSYLSQNEAVAHFGLGGATTASRASVTFAGGQTRELTQVAANQAISVTP